MNKLIILCGPTMSGKTELGKRLSNELKYELVNIDTQFINGKYINKLDENIMDKVMILLKENTVVLTLPYISEMINEEEFNKVIRKEELNKLKINYKIFWFVHCKDLERERLMNDVSFINRIKDLEVYFEEVREFDVSAQLINSNEVNCVYNSKTAKFENIIDLIKRNTQY